MHSKLNKEVSPVGPALGSKGWGMWLAVAHSAFRARVFINWILLA